MTLLDGLRVVEVALLAPNMLGMHLADLGAEVIKVEEPGRGDYTRVVGTARVGRTSFLHLRWNRGKQSIAIDLRESGGVDLFLELVRVSEVVIEGLRAGALERRGLGYETLQSVNPAVVVCSLSGFGQTGPYRDLATHGVAYDAYAGLAPPETTPDGFPAIPRRYNDIGTQAGALYAATAVLAAVVRARATNQGAHLDVAQADAAVAWTAGRLDPLLSGAKTPAEGGGMQASVRYQYYATADGRHILFQATERHFFERFCHAVEREDLIQRAAGSEFGEHARGDTALRQQLAGLFVTRTQEQWVRLFIEADIPGGPVHATSELEEDPQFRARARIHDQELEDKRSVRLLANPVRSDVPPADVSVAPTVGEHTDDVLTRVLGYDRERIARARARGIVA